MAGVDGGDPDQLEDGGLAVIHVPGEWQELVASLRATFARLDDVRRLAMIAVACEHLLPFAKEASAAGMAVDTDVLQAAVDAVWGWAAGGSPAGLDLELVNAQIPTDWAGVGLSGYGAEQVAGLVRALHVADAARDDPSVEKVTDALVGAVDYLSNIGDLAEQELAAFDGVAVRLRQDRSPSPGLEALRHEARRRGEELLEQVKEFGLWGR